MGFDVDLLGPPEDSDGDDLAHYGVKGMRWGHRKEDETSGRESGKAETSSKKPAFTIEEFLDSAKYNPDNSPSVELRKNKEKFISKTDPSSAVDKPEGRLTPEQKRNIAIAGVGALAVAGVIGYSIYRGKQISPTSAKTFLPGETPPWLAQKELSPESKFMQSVWASQDNTWGGAGYINEASWSRPAFTLPPDHTFNRISRASESGFKGATYSTHSVEDFQRYVIGFRHELGDVPLTHVSWTSKAPVRVPDLKTTLDGLTVAMERQGLKTSPKDVMQKYNSMSGGGWDDPLSKTFFEVLGSRGFSAIVDEMDAGVIGETPLVLFNHANMSSKTSVPLTSASIAKAAAEIKDFPKPPRK